MTKKKITSRQIQASQTRAKILSTAKAMMKENGYHNVTIEEISQQAGVSVGAFYYYFPTKQDVLNEVFSQVDVSLEKYVSEIPAETPSNEAVKAFFAYYAEHNMENGLDFVKQLFHTDNKFFISKNRRIFSLLFELIERCREDGSVSKSFTAEEAGNHLIVIARGVIFDWCLHDGGYDLLASMRAYISTALKGFGNEKS